MCRHSSVEPDSKGALWVSPALLMQTSTPPYCSLMAANIATISSSLETSHLIAVREPFAPFRLSDRSCEKVLCKTVAKYYK